MDISLRDLRPRLTAVIALVKAGETVNITERGKVVAAIVQAGQIDPKLKKALEQESPEAKYYMPGHSFPTEAKGTWAELPPEFKKTVAHTKSVQKAKDELLKRINRS